jgi:dipeptidyl aminopeptidase/acylaminoacyl peptidase
MRILIGASAAIILSQGAIVQARPAQPADLLALEEVADPQIAPDGDAIVYTVTKANVEEDKNVTHVWIAAWDGSGTRQLTGREGESESSPKFSPDGSLIGFISTRADKDEEGQLWLLPRAGGQAQPLAGITGRLPRVG